MCLIYYVLTVSLSFGLFHAFFFFVASLLIKEVRVDVASLLEKTLES